MQASHFVLQTDASAGGLGAILQQDGHAIAYASCVLNKAECQLQCHTTGVLGSSVWHEAVQAHLLGLPFKHWTDHEPLKWLTNQTLEGMLEHWPLALQEYSFTVVRQSEHQC